MLDRLEMARVRVARNFISFIEITADMQLSNDVVNSRGIKRSTRAVNQLTNDGSISVDSEYLQYRLITVPRLTNPSLAT